MLNITDNSVSKWERGINAPDIYYLQTLAELFQVTVLELLNSERKFKKKEIDLCYMSSFEYEGNIFYIEIQKNDLSNK